MKLLKKIPWSTVYLIATIVILLIFAISNDQTANIIETLSHLSFSNISIAVLLLFGYILIEALLIIYLLRSTGEKVRMLTGLKVGIVGVYYCEITPSATGGQPAQVAYLKRDDNVTVANSVATLSLKFFTYQLAFVILILLAFVFMYDKIMLTTPEIIPVVIGGIVINVLWILLFFQILFSQKFLTKLCNFLRKLIMKFKFIKHKEKRIQGVDAFEREFSDCSNKFRTKKKLIFTSVLMSLPQVLMKMSILYFVFRAFGNTENTFLEITSIQTLLQASVCFAPMPGAAGAQEIGFLAYMSPYFSEEQIFAAVMIWRFFTYYLVIIMGALVIIVDEIFQKRKRRNKILNL